MVTITLHCPGCQSDALVRNGHAPNGKQLYRCRACGRQSRENPTPNAYRQARRDELLHVYQERSSLRGLARTDRASLARPCRVGSKKPTDLGVDCPVSQDATGGRLCDFVTGACHTWQRLWEAIPSAYRKGPCFTDFWAAYQAVIPDEQHTAVGPRDGRNRPCGALE